MATSNTPSLRKHLLEKRATDCSDVEKFKALELQLNTQILSFLEALELKNANFIKSIAFYYPIKGEPDISASLFNWAAKNPDRNLALPITKKDAPLEFARWGKGDDLTEGLYSIPEPLNSELITPDLIIAPCLGWLFDNRSAWRIGYGAGYYDRTMAKLTDAGKIPMLVGVGLEGHQVTKDEWQPKVHDIPMDALITESRIYKSQSINI